MAETSSPSVTSWLLHPSQMIDWMKGKLQDFYTLPARISALRTAAGTVISRAQEQGKPELASAAQGVSNQLAVTASNQMSVQTRIASWLSDLGKLGIRLPGLSGSPQGTLGILPAIPIALIVAGGVVGVAIAAIFADYERQKGILAKVAQGVMSPEEAARLIESGKAFSFNVGSALKPLAWVAGIGALIYFWPQISSGLKRRRAAA